MKRLICLITICTLLLSVASADILSIDTSTATDDEVSAMLELLRTEKINRIITRLANETIAPDADGLIMFRNIPWYEQGTLLRC